MSSPFAGQAAARADTPLVFWLPSACRSVAPLCEAVAEQHGAGVTVVLQQLQTANRTAMHWEAFPFRKCDVHLLPQTASDRDVMRILHSRDEAAHIFASYHKSSPILTAALEAKKLNLVFGMLSEAPLSMRTGISRAIHQLYMATILPRRVQHLVRAARFLLCESGCDFTALTKLGWTAQQLFPFGYFPDAPPYRAMERPNPFLRILSVGGLSLHKGTHVLMDACKVLKERGVPFECDIIGDGPERAHLIGMAKTHGLLDVFRFHGFVDDANLSDIASRCAVLACPGIEEPWGIRVNDAIHAGFVPVVSRGVGASQIVARFGAGLVFPEGDSIALAECLSTLHHNPSLVADLRTRIAVAAKHISPQVAAGYLRAVVSYCTTGSQERPSPVWL
jgi:glycosyltransferase involved in cell wall biosynthesis